MASGSKVFDRQQRHRSLRQLDLQTAGVSSSIQPQFSHRLRRWSAGWQWFHCKLHQHSGWHLPIVTSFGLNYIPNKIIRYLYNLICIPFRSNVLIGYLIIFLFFISPEKWHWHFKNNYSIKQKPSWIKLSSNCSGWFGCFWYSCGLVCIYSIPPDIHYKYILH